MYRCYVIHDGRIAKAVELSARALDDAIGQGHLLLQTDPDTTADSGIEIWQLASLLYSDRRHAVDTGRPSIIASPFAPFAAAIC